MSPAESVLPLPPAEPETASFPWTWEVTPEQFHSYLATNSAIIAMPETERALRLDGSEAIIAKVCHETGRATAPLHHEAFCIRWTPS